MLQYVLSMKKFVVTEKQDIYSYAKLRRTLISDRTIYSKCLLQRTE